MPFDKESIDIVLCFDVFHLLNLYQRKDLFEELIRY
ncbi:MAG: class I SAM-dependent methyltransferase [Promethearchaeota archaeon]